MVKEGKTPKTVKYHYNPSTKEVDTGRLEVQGQPVLHSKSCLQNKGK